MSYDLEKPPAPLASIAKGFHEREYYDAAFYAFSDRDYDNKPIDPYIEYAFSVGGRWDHSVYGFMLASSPNVSGSCVIKSTFLSEQI